MISRFRNAMLVSAAVLALAAVVGASPAYAGEAGRVCRTYYHLNNPSLGGFTACVKLEHDPAAHSWRTNASVTTTTSGVRLHTATATLYSSNSAVAEASKPPAGSQNLGIVTPWWRCSGQVSLVGRVWQSVTWPDGSVSQLTTTDTPTVSGSC